MSWSYKSSRAGSLCNSICVLEVQGYGSDVPRCWGGRRPAHFVEVEAINQLDTSLVSGQSALWQIRAVLP